MQFESARHFLYEATINWLEKGAIENHANGEYETNPKGGASKLIKLGG
jgi:hypothetical protein